jgi:hypothetical protein
MEMHQQTADDSVSAPFLSALYIASEADPNSIGITFENIWGCGLIQSSPRASCISERGYQ